MKKLFFVLFIFFISSSYCMHKNKKVTKNYDLYYLQATKKLEKLEKLPADLKNIPKLKEVQKNFENARITRLDSKKISRINTIFLPYIKQLINTQTLFASTKIDAVKSFLPLTEDDFKKEFKSFNSLIRNIKGDTILQHALRLKLPCESIRYLLSCGQSINDINNNKENALHIATSINNTAILKLLLSYQDEIKQFFPITDTLTTPAQINVQDIVGQTPLHKTCIHNSIDCTKILLDYNASPAIKDNNNKQPIDYLFEQPWTYASALICQIFADLHEPNRLSQDKFYISILEEIKNIPTENLKNLTPELKNKIESYNEIKIIFQAIDKKILTAEILKKNYRGIDQPNENGKTPLCWCLDKNPGYCRLLLELKADPNKKSDFIVKNPGIPGVTGLLVIPTTLTPLEYVVYASKTRISESQFSSFRLMELLISNTLIELLLQHGANPNSGKIFPPLHYMAELDSDKKISLLLDNKANINMLDCFGQTALQIACKYNCLKSVVELLCRDADPTIVNEKDNNKTALDYCYDKKHDALIALLLSFKATTQQEIFINGHYSGDMDHITNFVRLNRLDVKISYDKNGKKGIYLESKD